MEVILKTDVAKLGYKDEIVTVRNGYGLNYLIPQGFAILATPSNRKILAENLKQRAHKEAKIKEEAAAKATAIQAMTLKIGAKAGETGKIFGSVNTIQLADAIKANGVEIDRKAIAIKGDAIKTLGNYQAEIKLHKEVNIEIAFEVVEG
ncbi:MAG TPA: 50S ribosomal protein L9 [Luteibaculaceae bacterium]|nr:50S ribosomal protein L9 [Luteibaculaceae bacterium]